MALTDQQQADIIYFLGWPGKTILVDTTHYNSVIASRLINLSPAIESQANALITRIKNIDKILIDSTARMSTLELKDIKLDATEAHKLRRERITVIRELSDLLDIDINKKGGSNISVVS